MAAPRGRRVLPRRPRRERTAQAEDCDTAVHAPQAHDLIEPYNHQWPAEYAIIEDLLNRALTGIAVGIDHIGSTSVRGLAAKNIIDIQITVADLGDPRLTPAFEELGATATDHRPPGSQSQSGAWDKRYFRAPESWRPTHLHVREQHRPNQRYALLFRDYLRQSPNAAAAYSAIKTALARLHPNDTQAYYDVKDPACDLIMDAAERWAAVVAWRPDQGGNR